MTAKDCISPLATEPRSGAVRAVEASLPVLEVLPRLLDAPEHILAVDAEPSGRRLGFIDEHSLLEALGSLIAARDDCSTIVAECAASDYSASAVAHAVEDADAHLVDLLTAPTAAGRLRLTLRVRHSDPSAASRSLERHGFDVVEMYGASTGDAALAAERLMGLQLLLNV